MKKQSPIRLLTILLSISLLTALVGCSSHSGSEDLGENKDTESYIKRTYPEEISHDDAPLGERSRFWYINPCRLFVTYGRDLDGAMLRIFDGIVYDISQRFRCPFEVTYSKSIVRAASFAIGQNAEAPCPVFLLS